MILKVDSVIDELSDDLFQIIVFDNTTMETYCHVFGGTPEECEQRANDLAYAYNTSMLTI